jgi:ferredoxin-NADP reductase
MAQDTPGVTSGSTATEDDDDDLVGGPRARAAMRWRDAVVASVEHPSDRAVVLRLQVPRRVTHRPGQHYVVRLRAPDGYTASRSYSVTSAPGDGLVELWVDRIVDGEVSGYLAEEAQTGDELEVRGPIGRWFAWDAAGPALGVGGGSGVAPLVSMRRHAADLGRPELFRTVVSARDRDQLPFADELTDAEVVRLTGEGDPRLDAEALAPLLDPTVTVFLCGSARFTGAMESLLVDLGQPASTLRVERFGPTS